MRNSLSILLLAISFSAFSQNNSPVHLQIERILEEKIKIKEEALLKKILENPAAFAQHSNFQSLPETQPAQDRDAEIVVNGDSKAESELHAAINPTDTANIIVAAILQDVSNPLEPIKVPVYVTKNFGTTWTKAPLNTNPDGGFVLGGGDPVIAFDASGKAYISWLLLTVGIDLNLSIKLYLASSTNKGSTWTLNAEPIDAETASFDVILGGSGGGKFVDKQWMAIDNNASSSHEGNLYISYTWLNQIDSVTGETKIFVKSKAKNSQSLSGRIQVHQNEYAFMQFSSIDVDVQGNVHVIFTAGNDSTDIALYHAVSTDGGLTFQPETKISALHYPSFFSQVLENTISGIDDTRLYPCPHVKAANTAGTIYATWTADGVNSQLTGGYDIYFSKSSNNGQNWSVPVAINAGSDPSAEQYYSALTVNSNDVLCVSYYDRTDDPSGNETHYNVSFSMDQGVTFAPSIHASTQTTDFSSVGLLNGNFGIGEYTQIVATSSYAIPVWSDGRSNDGDIDLYAAIIPIGDQSSGTGEVGTISDAFSIEGPTPNPAKSRANFKIALNRPSDLLVQVFNSEGKLVHNEASVSRMPAGVYSRTVALDKGAYFLRIETEFGFKTKKIVVE